MEKEKHYSVLSDVFYLIKHLLKYQPIIVLFSLIEIVLGAVSPLLGIYLPKLAVDLVVRKESLEKGIIVIGVFALISAIVSLVQTGVAWGKYNYNNEQRPFFMALLFEKSLRINYAVSEKEKQIRYTGKRLHHYLMEMVQVPALWLLLQFRFVLIFCVF